jgi:[ribosomal protein S5]-alanine N-acetyltransferase
LPHVPGHLLALFESSSDYEEISGFKIADGVRELLISSSPDFMSKLKTGTESDPWRFGFAVFHKADNCVIGMCGFVDPPTADGTVEIGYGIAPGYQGQGYATEVAVALVDFARRDLRVKIICAHTLAETNASTRVLEKSGFKRMSAISDPEHHLLWRWEKPVTAPSTSGSARRDKADG